VSGAPADPPGRPGPTGSPAEAAPAEPLRQRLAAEIRAALKGGEKVRLSALRLLSASVKNREVELRREVSDDELRKVATREVKRRKEAAEAYEAAGRPDRAALEREEQVAIEAYLPAGLSEEEVDAIVREAISATGATGPGDVGKVMGVVMGRAKGRADDKVVQAKVRGLLSSEGSGG
jgi:uncharacterized protein YqeY